MAGLPARVGLADGWRLGEQLAKAAQQPPSRLAGRLAGKLAMIPRPGVAAGCLIALGGWLCVVRQLAGLRKDLATCTVHILNASNPNHMLVT